MKNIIKVGIQRKNTKVNWVKYVWSKCSKIYWIS